MSKSSLFWGTAQGKLGQAVLYRAGGEQRARTYLGTIKNPRTLAQVANRVAMANFNGFYRSLKAILKDSFTDRPVRQSGFNALIARSKRASSPAIPVEWTRRGLSVPIGMALSSGSSAWQPNEQVVQGSGMTALAIGIGVPLSAPASQSITPLAGPLAMKDALVSMLAVRGSWWDTLPRVFNLVSVASQYVDEAYKNYYSVITIDGSRIVDFTTEEGIAKLQVNGDFNPTEFGVYPYAQAITADGRVRLAVAAAPGSFNDTQFAGAFVSYKDANGKLIASNSHMINVFGAGTEQITQYLPGGDTWVEVMRELGVNPDEIIAAQYTESIVGKPFVPAEPVPTYTISVETSDASRGSVSGGGQVQEGQSVVIRATANESQGWEFWKWNDDNTQNPRTIIATENATYTATFRSNGEITG